MFKKIQGELIWKIKRGYGVIFILTFISFFIVSCGSEVDLSTNNTSGLIQVETENWFINIPTNWVVIDNKENILPKAKEGKIELAVASENIVDWFANNLLILSDDLKVFTSSKDFSMLNNIWAETDYLDYTKIESKEFLFLDWEPSMLYVFEAKYNLDTPKLKFLQTAHTCKQTKVIFFTIAIPTNVIDISKYEYLLSTFICK